MLNNTYKTYRNNNIRVNSLTSLRRLRTRANPKGFTLMECVIAICLTIIVLGGLAILLVNTIRNGKFVEKLADTNILLSDKTNQLFNSTPIEVSKIPTGQKQAGSIDPLQPIPGYFDVLNQSGCIIKRSQSLSNIDISTGIKTVNREVETGIKGGIESGSGSTSETGGIKGGEIGGSGTVGTGSLGDLLLLDCSGSTFNNPSQSLEPKFRRQWIVTKGFPNTGDVTFSVVIVAIQTNQITLANTITKTDGSISK